MPPNIDMSATIRDSSVVLSAALLNPGDYLILQVLSSGASADPLVLSRISGVSTINKLENLSREFSADELTLLLTATVLLLLVSSSIASSWIYSKGEITDFYLLGRAEYLFVTLTTIVLSLTSVLVLFKVLGITSLFARESLGVLLCLPFVFLFYPYKRRLFRKFIASYTKREST